MPQVQVCVGIFRRIDDRSAIGVFRLGPAAAFLQRMTVLHPNRRIARLAIQRRAVETGCELPLPRLASAVGAADDGRFATLSIKKRHRSYSVNSSGAETEQHKSRSVRLRCGPGTRR